MIPTIIVPAEPVAPKKRPRWLIAALIGALIFGAGCWTEGCEKLSFYRGELAPNWEGLTQEQRAHKIDQFIELSHMLGQAEPGGHPSDQFLEIVATVHVKVLLLAWAHDRTYSYMDRLFNGPLQYRSHRYRLADGRV